MAEPNEMNFTSFAKMLRDYGALACTVVLCVVTLITTVRTSGADDAITRADIKANMTAIAGFVDQNEKEHQLIQSRLDDAEQVKLDLSVRLTALGEQLKGVQRELEALRRELEATRTGNRQPR